jgi:hypothetical protein
MLFDLRGRRRRAVQATYLTLALLMGGGLVLFGIGGDVSGGLFDAFSERGGGGAGNDLVEKRIERNQKKLRANSGNEAALKALVRDNYQLATAQTESTSVGFPNEAKDELAKAGAYWDRYLDGEPERPDASLAAVALQIFDVTALNRPRKAQRAAAIIANEQEEPASYLRLVQYAALAGDTRTADLAAQKAVDLAPKEEKKQVKEQAEQLKRPQAQTQPQGG